MAVSLLWLSSCSDKADDLIPYDTTRNPEHEVDGGGLPSYVTSHFITEFVDVNKIEIYSKGPGRSLHLNVKGEEYETYRDKDYEYYEKAKYFSNLYGDNSYNGRVTVGSHSVLAYPIEKITIWCEKDYDAEHPAGTPLDDIVALNFSTYNDFIKSGYKFYNEDLPEWERDRARVEYRINFNEINEKTSNLSRIYLAQDNLGFIYFDSQPTEVGAYPFTIEVTINGKVMTKSFTHSFE